MRMAWFLKTLTGLGLCQTKRNAAKRHATCAPAVSHSVKLTPSLFFFTLSFCSPVPSLMCSINIPHPWIYLLADDYPIQPCVNETTTEYLSNDTTMKFVYICYQQSQQLHHNYHHYHKNSDNESKINEEEDNFLKFSYP